MTALWLTRALLDEGERGVALAESVRLEVEDGLIASIERGATARPGDRVLEGLALPGFANAHSHAFHRALRGRTHADGGDFWTWREVMYAAAGRLDPGLYQRLCTALWAEMLLAGYTAVGEFHYLHRRLDGSAYSPDTAMADAVVEAAGEAGMRLTLLHTAYTRGGLAADGAAMPASPAQGPFVESVGDWAARHGELRGIASRLVRRAAAIHSVRGVDPEDIPVVLAALDADEPLHVHVSEQPAENAQSLAAYGLSPVAVLSRAGALSPRLTVVHGTHVDAHDIGLLSRSGALVCICPSTERDLADGIGPVREYLDAGVAVCLGSDQHVVVDPLDELRQLEGHERLGSGRRGRIAPADALQAATANGYRSLGWNGGRLAVGAVADLVVLDDRSVRTAGSAAGYAWTAAAAADVRHTVVDGTVVVDNGVHALGDTGAVLASVIEEVWA